MGATAIVAVTGAISTLLVAIAGYIFNARRARDDRAANRELAIETHAHERQLAEGQREHETRLRCGERAYNDRRDTYVELVRTCFIVVERVRATEPLITFEGQAEPPEMPDPDQWRDLQARVSAFGSREVDDATSAFFERVQAFFAAAGVYRSVRDRPTGDLQDASEQMTRTRTEVGQAIAKIQTLVRDDLANL